MQRFYGGTKTNLILIWAWGLPVAYVTTLYFYFIFKKFNLILQTEQIPQTTSFNLFLRRAKTAQYCVKSEERKKNSEERYHFTQNVSLETLFR